MKNSEADSESDEMGGDCVPGSNKVLGLITQHVFCRLSSARCSAHLLLVNVIKHSAVFKFGPAVR